MYRHPRKISILVVMASALLLQAACGGAGEAEEEPMADEPSSVEEATAVTAIAELSPTEGNSAQGTVTFEQTDSRVRIVAHVTGLEPGEHGFHIHETGDCSAPDASSAGGHFAPEGHPHGGPDSPQHHAGDLGNITADEAGAAHKEMTVDYISLGEGSNSVIGKAVIVHNDADDLETQPTGAAGGRLACGVIQLQGSATSTPGQ